MDHWRNDLYVIKEVCKIFKIVTTKGKVMNKGFQNTCVMGSNDERIYGNEISI